MEEISTARDNQRPDFPIMLRCHRVCCNFKRLYVGSQCSTKPSINLQDGHKEGVQWTEKTLARKIQQEFKYLTAENKKTRLNFCCILVVIVHGVTSSEHTSVSTFARDFVRHY